MNLMRCSVAMFLCAQTKKKNCLEMDLKSIDAFTVSLPPYVSQKHLSYRPTGEDLLSYKIVCSYKQFDITDSII